MLNTIKNIFTKDTFLGKCFNIIFVSLLSFIFIFTIIVGNLLLFNRINVIIFTVVLCLMFYLSKKS